MSTTKKNRGFTLIELLVVVAIIGVLSSTVLSSMNNARISARDTDRRIALGQVKVALELYYNKFGTYQVANSGYNNGGNGWFGYENGSIYTTAISRALYNQGFLSKPLVEDLVQKPGYMMYICSPKNYSVFATLEKPTAADVAHIQTVCNGPAVAATYGKNFAVTND